LIYNETGLGHLVGNPVLLWDFSHEIQMLCVLLFDVLIAVNSFLFMMH